MIEDFTPGNNSTRARFPAAKKIDLGNCYLIFVSGIQPPAGEDKVVITDDVAEQTRLVFEEIQKSLNLAGASLDNVIKSVIYLADIKDFNIISPVRTEYFKNATPVSTLVEVSGFTRKGTKIEIEVTALLPK